MVGERPYISLRYLVVSSGEQFELMLLEAQEPARAAAVKLAMLRQLGIAPNPGERPLYAWLLAMARENQLAATVPAAKPLIEAIAGNLDAMAFMFAIA